MCKEAPNHHKLSDIITVLSGTDDQVWEVIERIIKERNKVKEVPEQLKMQYETSINEKDRNLEERRTDQTKT